ncbi:MAG: phenylacetate--CoA ligase [Chloroflexi bacterium]|nr:phenylacetate--CoA ligase [Chloroflexota bacterium]
MYQPQLESLPRAELEALQLEQLRATLKRIHDNNPRYAERLNGFGPGDVRCLDDIRLFPFLTKEDLRQAYPFGLTCAPRKDFARMHMSSGTTGTPIICPHTPNDVRQWAEIVARCVTAAGVTREDVFQITPSFGLFNGGFGFHYGVSAVGAMIIPIGAGRSPLQLQFMRDLGTTAFSAIASYPLRLIEVADKEGFDFRRDTQLRVGILGAEIWSDEMRRRIEGRMGIESFDISGMTESGGVGMGIDCAEHDGIHVWEDHYLIEMVNFDTGEPLDDGEWGEMVVTTLTREGLPLIRFRTHDITRIVSREPCRCGRTGLRIARLSCRTDDMIKVKGVNFYPKQVESLLLGHGEVGSDYLIVIERVDGADRMTVNVEAASEGGRWTGDEAHRPTAETRRALAEQLSDELYNMLGLRAEVNLMRSGELPRPEGKAVRVQDKRNSR